MIIVIGKPLPLLKGNRTREEGAAAAAREREREREIWQMGPALL